VGRGVASACGTSPWAKKPCQVLRRRGNKHSDGRPGPHSFTIITLFIHPHAQPTRSIAPDPRHASQFKEGSRFVEFRHRIASHRLDWPGLACLPVCLALSAFLPIRVCQPTVLLPRARCLACQCMPVCLSVRLLSGCLSSIHLSICMSDLPRLRGRTARFCDRTVAEN
jgi:hypothetical protein